MHWRPRAPQRPSPAPGRPSAALEVIADGEGFHDMPLGGWPGQTLPTPPPSAAPSAPQPLEIPPPPWADDLAAGIPAPDPPAARMNALDEMRLGEEGYDPPPPGGPPLVLGPVQRPQFPAPDWRAEERERLEREVAEKKRAARARRAALLEDVLAEEREAYRK